ncbi:hypothetical protein [Brassicibacter mesophilus]|uniref:hypothetical protein n=1 Tax=Brassicibacter mesophilus TaxID=745119 RepID=UPI003D19313B
MDDLIRNTVHKVFIVSWTDSYDYSWLDEFGMNRTVVFDAEEEDPAYHGRVLFLELAKDEEEDDMLYLLLDNEKQFSIGISYIVDIEEL